MDYFLDACEEVVEGVLCYGCFGFIPADVGWGFCGVCGGNYMSSLVIFSDGCGVLCRFLEAMKGLGGVTRTFLKCAVMFLSPRQLRYIQSLVFKMGKHLGAVLRRNNALVVYYSVTGNTEKVAEAIGRGLTEAGLKVDIKRIESPEEVDFYGYDLVCFGSPVLHALP